MASNLWVSLGAMSLTQKKDRIEVAEGDPKGTRLARGIGISIHFILNGSGTHKDPPCCCDKFKIIQVVTTDNITDRRGLPSYVDNNNNHTSSFYADGFPSAGKDGRHRIPLHYPNGMDPKAAYRSATGSRIETTHSIYDRPFRPRRVEGTKWSAEACVVCVRDGQPDKILECVSYGYTRAAGKRTKPVVRGDVTFDDPSTSFLNALINDPSTEGYSFEPQPD